MVEKVDSCRDGRELFVIVKQRTEEKHDIIRVIVVKVKVEWWRLVWKQHMAWLNVENKLGNSITASKVIGVVTRIDILQSI